MSLSPKFGKKRRTDVPHRSGIEDGKAEDQNERSLKLVSWREYSLFNNTGYIHGPAYMAILQEKSKESKIQTVRRFEVNMK